MKNKLIYGNFVSLDIRELYNKTIWYNNTYAENTSQDKINELKEIAKNREIIAHRYKLSKNILNVPTHICKMFEITSYDRYFMYYDKYIRDNIEYYKTSKNEYVSIFSQYNREGIEKIILENGYELIEPIHSLKHKTYIKISHPYNNGRFSYFNCFYN